MIDDLISRLRDGEWWQTVVRGPNPTGFSTDQTPTAHEAAEALILLRDALEPFANLKMPARCQGNAAYYSVLHKQILAAREALSPTKIEKAE